MTSQERIRVLLEGADDRDLIPVRAAWLRELVTGEPQQEAPPVEVDLTAATVGKLFGRDESVVRGWCRAGLLPGAYRFNRREWRIPRSAVVAMQRSEQAAA